MQVDNSPPAKAIKRKASKGNDSSDEDESGDVEMLDVSFDFFDPQPHDYHSIKLLLSQLMSHDAKDLDMGGVADLVLEQKLVGSTVKTDGAEGDPYAVLTVLNLNVHKANSSIAALLKYLLAKLSTSPFHAELTALLATPVEESSAETPKHVGLVLSERLVNMPAQVVPPMYRMLQEELKWARDDKEPYHFSHLLFLSRVFLASSDDFEEDPNAALNPAEAAAAGGGKKGGKKSKKSHVAKEQKEAEQTWMYHPEDDFIIRLASQSHTFRYSNTPTEKAADSFGVETRGQVMLLPWTKFDEVVEGMEGFLGGLEQ